MTTSRRRPAPLVPAPIPLNGEWKNLGPDAFVAFVRRTAEAIVAELLDSEGVSAESVESPSGLARSRPADEGDRAD